MSVEAKQTKKQGRRPRKRGPKNGFVDFLLDSPLGKSGLEIARCKGGLRDPGI
jgi:hypothetical protein